MHFVSGEALSQIFRQFSRGVGFLFGNIQKVLERYKSKSGICVLFLSSSVLSFKYAEDLNVVSHYLP